MRGYIRMEEYVANDDNYYWPKNVELESRTSGADEFPLLWDD